MNMFVVRQSAAKPSDQTAYGEAIATLGGKSAKSVGSIAVLRVDQGTFRNNDGEDLSYVMGLHARVVELGKIPDWGKSSGTWIGNDSEGCRVVALFY